MKEATKEQIESAKKAFDANKNLKKVFVTQDNQAFEDFNFAFSHSRERNYPEPVEIEKADLKKDK